MTIKKPSRISRRSAVGLLAAPFLLSHGLGAAAQTIEAKWWENLFDPPGSRNRRDADAARQQRQQQDVLNDLREDPTPWRSDVMVDNMEEAIGFYQQIVNRGGWQGIPKGRQLRPGDDDERVPLLRRRLAMSGDLHVRAANESYSFDDNVEVAVKGFQERHGLRVTGRVDPPTLAQLNVSAMGRLDQLKLNQRRIRELANGRIEERYILVNVPAFQLEAVEGFEVRQRHRVIVGKPDRQTPSVKATVRALNFFPYWRVPDSVANLDLIPRLQKEPEYLRKEQIRAFNGFGGSEIDTTSVNWRQVDHLKVKFRQDPGPQNALGLVRIDMPNEHIVYMHDTPLKTLFNQRDRAFSAGCVRVQDVFELVKWIARYEPGWQDPARVEDTLNAGTPADVTLSRPIPVYFTYVTAWAERNGRVEFRPDMYGRDGSRDFAGERDLEAPGAPQTLAP